MVALVGPDGNTDPPLYTNTGAHPLCVRVVDASPVTVSLVVQCERCGASPVPLALASPSVWCGTFPVSTTDGNATLTANATDAAGNPSPLVAGWLLVDRAAPTHRLTPTITRGRTCNEIASTGVEVCDAPDGLDFSAACVRDGGLVATAPCFLEWVLQVSSVGAATSCGVGGQGEPEGALWQPMPSPGSPSLALGPLVTAAAGPEGDVQVVLYTRARDAAGNVEVAGRTLWYVDRGVPGAPTLPQPPDQVTLLRVHNFEFHLRDASPGALALNYTLVGRGGALVPGLPPASVPAPSAGDPTALISTLGLPALDPGAQYTLRVWAVDQAGHVSVDALEVSWHVLAALPPVALLAGPSPVSGTWLPSLRVGVDWGAQGPPPGDEGVTLEFSLLGDRSLGAFHAPSVCNGSLAGTHSAVLPTDCVAPGCSSRRCTYHLALPRERGTKTAYTVEVGVSGGGVCVCLVWGAGLAGHVGGTSGAGYVLQGGLCGWDIVCPSPPPPLMCGRDLSQ